MIDVADDHDREDAFVAHMYPAERNFSNASSLSWSIARPARSGCVVVSSSAMISASVAASLLIGVVMFFSPSDRYR